MWRIVIAAVAANCFAWIGSVQLAAAADLGEPRADEDDARAAPAVWSGFYIGANAGYGFGEDESGIDVFDPNGQAYATGPLPYGLEPDGGFAGLQIGFNRQHRGFVFGIEGDIQISDVGEEASKSFDPPAIFDFDYSASLDIDWFGTLRGRAGYAMDRTLIYVTGGLAFGKVEYKAEYFITEPCCPGGFANLKEDGVETGYVLGAGLEHAFDDRWSFKIEYQYIDLGDQDVKGDLFFAGGAPSGETVKSSYDAEFHAIRIGVNYRLAPREEPLK
jgi:outer membrane immunogenic protein